MKTKKDFTKLPKKPTTKKKKAEQEKIKQLTRLIKLIITLNSGVLNLDHAAQECGVSRRTITRDVNLLQMAGLPLYKPNEQNVNYRLRSDFQLAKFQVTKENALAFVQTLDVLNKNTPLKPVQWVLPIQKEVEKAGRKEQKKQKDECKQVFFNTTDELLMSGLLSKAKMEEQPYPTLLFALEICRQFNQKEKNALYAQWQKTELFHVMARWSWLNRQYKDALFWCNQFIKSAPKDPRGYRQAVLICYTLKDHQQAYKYIADGLKQNKTDIVLHFYWIYLCMLDKNYQGAMKLFNAAYKSKFGQTHFAATMYAYERQFDKALEVIEQAQKDDPQNASVYDTIKEQVLDLKAQKH